MTSSAEMNACFVGILETAQGSTDVLYSEDFTSKADKYLATLSDEDREAALSLLTDEYGPFPYYHETHDFNKEPFKADGTCRHGLDSWTCPCGCGEL